VSYIVTLRLDDESFAAFDALRRRHFPAERNFLAAHVTLFHQLPEDDDAAVPPMLANAAAATAAFPLEFVGPRSLGRGVAFDVRSQALLRLRRRLADAFEPWLTRQDAQGFRPHVTVQNKATAEAARELLAVLTAATDTPRTGQAEGLLLWRYAGGPWDAVDAFAFREATASGEAAALREVPPVRDATASREATTPGASTQE
jgi:2'-5' RNA ligase